MADKKRWPVWKIVLTVIGVIVGVMVVINIISFNITGEYVFKSEKEPTSEEQGVDLNNLSVGETAVWDNYSLTVDSVQLEGDVVVANITMDAKTYSTFAGRYMEGIDASGNKVAAEEVNDVSLEPDESYTTSLRYPSTQIDALEWDNWSSEAIWRFEPLAAPAEATPVETQEPEAEPEEADSDAFTAIELYGRAMYPYGFKLHVITGQLANYRIAPNTYEIKILCDVTNAYGATAKNQTCEATVEKVGDTWEVRDFLVY